MKSHGIIELKMLKKIPGNQNTNMIASLLKLSNNFRNFTVEVQVFDEAPTILDADTFLKNPNLEIIRLCLFLEVKK